MGRKDKIIEYKKRESAWADNAIAQLSFSLQVLTGICIGFLSYLFSQNILEDLCIKSHCSFDFKNAFALLSIIFIFLSVIYGILSIISRLYDGRLTRNIAQTRRRYYQYKGKKPKDDTPPELCWFEQTPLLMKLLFCGIDVISMEHIKQGNFVSRFHENRRIAHNLGLTTWRYHKLQFLFLFSGILFYSLYEVVKIV